MATIRVPLGRREKEIGTAINSDSCLPSSVICNTCKLYVYVSFLVLGEYKTRFERDTKVRSPRGRWQHAGRRDFPHFAPHPFHSLEPCPFSRSVYFLFVNPKTDSPCRDVGPNELGRGRLAVVGATVIPQRLPRLPVILQRQTAFPTVLRWHGRRPSSAA